MKFRTWLSVFTAVLTLSVLSPATTWAQSKVPARQVSVVSTNWDYITPASDTSQSTFDWLDASLDSNATFLALSSASWTNFLSTVTNVASLQLLLDEIDAESGPFLAGTYITDASYDAGTLTWTLYTNGFAIDTDNWTTLAPTASTVQATFDYIDALGPLLPGTNISGATYSAITEEWTIDEATNNTPSLLFVRELESDSTLTNWTASTKTLLTTYTAQAGYMASNFANGYFTVPADGIYVVNASVQASGTAGAIASAFIGVTVSPDPTSYTGCHAEMVTGKEISLKATYVRNFAAGTTIGLYVQSDESPTAAASFGDRFLSILYLGEQNYVN